MYCSTSKLGRWGREADENKSKEFGRDPGLTFAPLISCFYRSGYWYVQLASRGWRGASRVTNTVEALSCVPIPHGRNGTSHHVWLPQKTSPRKSLNAECQLRMLLHMIQISVGPQVAMVSVSAYHVLHVIERGTDRTTNERFSCDLDRSRCKYHDADSRRCSCSCTGS